MSQWFTRLYQDWKAAAPGSEEETAFANDLRRLYAERLGDGTIPPTMTWEVWWEEMKKKNAQPPAGEVGGAGHL